MIGAIVGAILDILKAIFGMSAAEKEKVIHEKSEIPNIGPSDDDMLKSLGMRGDNLRATNGNENRDRPSRTPDGSDAKSKD